MSGFEVGEVVWCAPDDECTCPVHRVANTVTANPEMTGRYHRVLRVYPGYLSGNPDCCGGLGFEQGNFCAGTFRKLPRADADFTEQMRACKPQHKKEPA